MHVCYVLTTIASALGLLGGIAKVGLKSSSTPQPLDQQKPWAQLHWDEAMAARMQCKATCLDDEACTKQCPKPWIFMQEKCAAAQPIWECHEQCGHDHACHDKCPLPHCPKAAQKVKDAIQCHGKCGSDHECHHSCGHPLSQMTAICESFGHVSSCHKSCAHGDHECHSKCPRMFWPAPDDGKHHEPEHHMTYMQNECEEARPIMECHMQCPHDNLRCTLCAGQTCHEKCPLPHCSKQAAKVKEVIQCHGKCNDDRECHHSCGSPVQEMKEKCEAFGMVSECHKACAYGDHECHKTCPHWPYHDHHHGNHSEHHHGNHREHGHWHEHVEHGWHHHGEHHDHDHFEHHDDIEHHEHHEHHDEHGQWRHEHSYEEHEHEMHSKGQEVVV